METFAAAFADKGRIRVGADADLALFDPTLVAARADYTRPFLAPIGMRYVVVAGTIAVADGALTDNSGAGAKIINSIGGAR